MWSAIEDTGKFLYKHRQKIAATTAVVGSAAFLYFYYGTSNDSITENITSNSAHFGDESYNEESAKNNSKELSDKKKLQLSRIRKQFENAREKFLPTLRVKIFEIVDVSDTIQEIRKLRNSQGKKGKVDSNTRLIEMQLWEKIKISSITILFVSVYMTSAICLILKIQFHLLGHYSYNCNSSLNSSRIIDSNLHTPVKGHQKPCDQNHSSNFMDMPSPIPMPASTNPFGDGVGVPAAVDAASSPSNTINTSYNRNNLTFNADIFLELIEKTYSYMLDRGIGELGDFIRAKAIEVFGSDGEESEEGAHEAKHKWNVLECKQVEYNDLISSFMQLRHSVEKDIQAHIIERVLLCK